ncbi:MAG: ABC transporter permease, partial [Gemmatimonadaceae bacterium]
MLAELWSDLRYRARALFRRADMERELDAEVRFHLDREAEKYGRLGAAPQDASRRARLAIGGVERAKEASRDGRGTAFIESMAQDLRYAARGMRAKPGFALGIVLTLALGIGANAAMFGIVDRLLLRPPAYLRDASRVHRVYFSQTVSHQPVTTGSSSIGRLLDFRRLTHSFSTVAGFATFQLPVGDGDAVRSVPVSGVSASYFHLFDARPALGRFFHADEDSLPTGVPVAVLGYAYWQSQFGGRSDVLGSQMHIGRLWFTIVGVAPKNFSGFDGGDVPAIWVPLAAFAWDLRPENVSRDFSWQFIQLAVERAPNVSLEQATADLTNAFVRSRLGQRPADSSWSSKVRALHAAAILGPVQADRGPTAGPDAKIAVWVGAVALIVLIIACANVANLHLARAVVRRREIGLRLALGVRRARLVRQLLTESLLLAALGGAAGLVVAQWGGAAVRALFIQDDARAAVLADPRTVVITALITL